MKTQIQMAGELPKVIEPGQQLVLGALGCVVTVVALYGADVLTTGSGDREAELFDIEPDGTMTLAQARECQLACDWDSSWPHGDFFACEDDEELEHTSPEQAVVARFQHKPWGLEMNTWVELVCPLEIRAYQRASAWEPAAFADPNAKEARVCFAVATKRYDATEVLRILCVRSGAHDDGHFVQDAAPNNVSI